MLCQFSSFVAYPRQRQRRRWRWRWSRASLSNSVSNFSRLRTFILLGLYYSQHLERASIPDERAFFRRICLLLTDTRDTRQIRKFLDLAQVDNQHDCLLKTEGKVVLPPFNSGFPIANFPGQHFIHSLVSHASNLRPRVVSYQYISPAPTEISWAKRI